MGIEELASAMSAARRQGGNDDWSSSEEDWLTAWNIITSIMSMAGSGFIVISMLFLSIKSYREDPSRTYLLKLLHFRLVFMLSVSDVMYSLAMLAGDPENKSSTCYWQAIWSSFFELTSLGWVLCIAFTLWQNINLFIRRGQQPSPDEENLLFYKMWIANWLFATFWTCIPLADGNHYADAGAWCWIDDSDTGQAMRYMTYYLWLWIAIILICIMYYQLIKQLHKLIRESPESGAQAEGQEQPNCCVVLCDIIKVIFSDESQHDVASAEMLRIMQRLCLYPVILIGCWTFGTINRLQNSFEPDNPNLGLFVMHMITSNLNGFFNSIVYGNNTTFRSDVKRYCCGWMGSKDPSQETSKDADKELDHGFSPQEDEVSPHSEGPTIRDSYDQPLEAAGSKQPAGAKMSQV